MFTSGEIRYLLHLYRLGENANPVRSTDLANALHVTRASVARMLKHLADSGIIVKQHYGAITLSEEGIRFCNRLFTRYTLLRNYFLMVVGVPEEAAETDAVGCLSVLTEDSIARISDLSLHACRMAKPLAFAVEG